MSTTTRRDGRGKTYQRGRPRVLTDPVRVTASIDLNDYEVLLRFIGAGRARTIAEAVRIAVRRGVDNGGILE